MSNVPLRIEMSGRSCHLMCTLAVGKPGLRIFDLSNRRGFKVEIPFKGPKEEVPIIILSMAYQVSSDGDIICVLIINGLPGLLRGRYNLVSRKEEPVQAGVSKLHAEQ